MGFSYLLVSVECGFSVSRSLGCLKNSRVSGIDHVSEFIVLSIGLNRDILSSSLSVLKYVHSVIKCVIVSGLLLQNLPTLCIV